MKEEGGGKVRGGGGGGGVKGVKLTLSLPQSIVNVAEILSFC